MIIYNQKIAFDIKIWDTILTKVQTVKFIGITLSLDENLTFNDHVNKVTIKYISLLASWGDSINCQLSADVMVKLYYSLVYFNLTFALLARGRLGHTNSDGIANYWQIITKRSSLFTQFIAILLYYRLKTQIHLIFINISRTKLSSH